MGEGRNSFRVLWSCVRPQEECFFPGLKQALALAHLLFVAHMLKHFHMCSFRSSLEFITLCVGCTVYKVLRFGSIACCVHAILSKNQVVGCSGAEELAKLW